MYTTDLPDTNSIPQKSANSEKDKDGMVPLSLWWSLPLKVPGSVLLALGVLPFALRELCAMAISCMALGEPIEVYAVIGVMLVVGGCLAQIAMREKTIDAESKIERSDAGLDPSSKTGQGRYTSCVNLLTRRVCAAYENLLLAL